MSKHNNNKIRSNQEGIVAIIVAVILTVLMSLIILAISQNANREQRQALDRQLSDQAFYNAESGVNDLANYLYKNIATVPAIPVDKKHAYRKSHCRLQAIHLMTRAVQINTPVFSMIKRRLLSNITVSHYPAQR